MPCYECENGKWKFGETGKCQYETKSECETANKDYYAEETYDDYPQAATTNAKRAIKYKEENGSSCGTVVGWTRARQIANREKLTRRTIARVASFKRHQQHKDVPYDEGCGGIMWDAWGGTEMIEWAIKKLEKIDKKSNEFKNEEEFEISETTKKTLKNKMEEHNENVKDLDVEWNPKVTVAKLEKVYKRGVGAYYTNPESVRESVTSPEQWAIARVNSFLFAMRNGKYRSGKHDTDLLPKNHPMKNTEKKENNMAKKKKYYGDEEHDFHFHFTEEMMAELHQTGELEVMVKQEDREMLIKFTYGEKEKKEEIIIEEEIKDEFEAFFNEIINKHKK
tara:strand:- start:2810 stop:3817 length:1008 start_codon:yes stop_codon:yes gene_type:complete